MMPQVGRAREALNRNAANETPAGMGNAHPQGAPQAAAPHARPQIGRDAAAQRPAGFGNVNPNPAPAAHVVVDQRQPPVMLNRPVGAEMHQAQAHGRQQHHAVHLPVPAPAPVFVAPAPRPAPAPVFVAPAPRPAPAPVFVAPAPAPVFVAPRPAPAPVFVAPAPVVVAPAPLPHVVVAAPAPHVPRPLPPVVVASPGPGPRPHVRVITNSWTPIVAFALAVLGIGIVASIIVPEAAVVIFPVALLIAVSSLFIKAMTGK